MFLLNDKPLAVDTPFIYNDIQYPSNWLRLSTAEEKAAIGITEVPDTPAYDDRFYWAPGVPKALEDKEEVDENGNSLWVKVLGIVDGKPAMVDSDKRLVTKGLKSNMVAQVKATAGSLLATTDWMVIRKMERNIDIPVKVANVRAAIIAEADRLENAIKATVSVEELISVLNSQQWGE
jgi:hypothetical protein